MTVDNLLKVKLPDEPGVYFFMGPRHEILYIGKATSLRSRVRSYFAGNIGETRGERIVDMLQKAKSVRFRQADSVLEALVLEVALIKKHKPPYNIRSRDDKSFDFVVITNEEFPKVIRERGKTIAEQYKPGEIKHLFGPFPSASSLREVLKIVRKIFPYRDDKCTLGQVRPCFNRAIGLCPGTCTGEITKKEYAKTIKKIALFFDGKTGVLAKQLEKDMHDAAKEMRFEDAQEYKRQLFSLKHIQDVSLIKDDMRYEAASGSRPQRIEAYDVAHMSGKNVVGVMVVSEDGEFKKSDYRKFILRRNPRNDDPGSLREILERRFAHPEWPLPSIMVVDGNDVQRSVARAVLEEKKLNIPVIGVTKDETHKARVLVGDEEVVSRHQKEIVALNAEAHRFAITFHRKRRDTGFYPH